MEKIHKIEQVYIIMKMSYGGFGLVGTPLLISPEGENYLHHPDLKA